MWAIKREPLLAALAILDLVPEKLGIPSSEFIYVREERGKVTLSSASYIAAEIVLEGDGEWPIKKDLFIDRRTFIPWIFAAKEIKDKNLFEFTRHKKSLVIRHGRRVITLESQHKVKGYGDVRKIKHGKHSSIPISDDLKEMLMCGKNCAVSDAVVPHLNTVYITKGASGGLGMEAYASSDKVYYVGTGELGNGKIKAAIPFPLYLINLLGVAHIRKITWIGKYIVVKFDQGIVWQPISEEALKQFPVKEIQRHSVRSDKLPVTFTAPSRRFTRIMVRLSYYLQSVRRKDWVVRIQGEKKQKYVNVTTSIPGAGFTERIYTSKRIPKSFKLEWPLDILEPTFEFLSKKTKKLGVIVRVDDKHGVSYIRTGNFWLCVTSQQE